MIPVRSEPEPTDFHEKVRKPGWKWLAKHQIPLDQPPPDPAKLPTHWRACQKELWDAYQGVCAYLCIYFEWCTGASSTDHFVAKSQHAGMAYEWSNYRLSCLGPNRKKNRFDDILDPFEIHHDTFVLNLASGELKPNPQLPPETQKKAKDAIKRLELDDPETNRMRARHFDDYCNGIPESYLKSHSPFVWYEAKRQGLL